MHWTRRPILEIGGAIALLLAAWELISQINLHAVLLASPFYFCAVVATVVGFHLALFVLGFSLLIRCRPGLRDRPESVAAALLLAVVIALLIAVIPMDSVSIPRAAGLLCLSALAAGIYLKQSDRSQAWKAFWNKIPAVAIAALCALITAIWVAVYAIEAETAGDVLLPVSIYGAAILLLCAPLIWVRPMALGRVVATAVIAVSFLLPIRALIPEVSEVGLSSVDMAGDLPIRRVILIVVDTLRADAISTINPDAATRTPRLDELAADAILFENAISPAPWTFPSMSSLMTGFAPYIDRRSYTYDLAPLPTLAGHLAASGYTTRALLGNQLLYKGVALTRGIERMTTYAVPPLGYGFFRSVVKNLIPGKLRAEYPGQTRRLTDRAFEWLDSHRDAPSFLWLHYMDPHDPYTPPLSALREGVEPNIWLRYSDQVPASKLAAVRSLYEGEVEFVDHEIGRLMDQLKQAGLYDDSLIVLTSDHGEEFHDHGESFHGHSLYQELLHVPLIIRVPGGNRGRRVSEYVPTLAVMPTILNLCEVDVPPVPLWPAPLTPLIVGEEDLRYDHPIVSAGVRRGEFQRSVVVDGLKYIHRLESGEEELYDLDADPREKHSILGSRPESLARAKEALMLHETGSARLRKEFALDGDSVIDKEMLNRLRSLGYIQ